MENKIDDYKAVIITGVNDKSDDVDAEVIYVGPIKDYSFHIDCLIDYTRDRYPDVNVFQHINDRCDPNVPIFFLTWLNSIVYINISGNRVGRYGMLFLPDEISVKQKEVLLDLSKVISKAHVDIVYDMDFDDGIVDAKEFDYKSGKGFEKLLDEFFKQKEKKSKK